MILYDSYKRKIIATDTSEVETTDGLVDLLRYYGAEDVRRDYYDPEIVILTFNGERRYLQDFVQKPDGWTPAKLPAPLRRKNA